MAWVRTIRREFTREQNAEIAEIFSNLLAMKMNLRSVVGSGEKTLLSYPGSELRPGREKEKKRVRT